MRRALLLGLAGLLLACPAAGAGAPPTSLRVTVDADGAGPDTPGTIRVRCAGPGDPTRACRTLRRLPREALQPKPTGVVCTQQWGGPQIARVVGRLRGRPVDLRYDRTDGCDIHRWDAAAPLLRRTGIG